MITPRAKALFCLLCLPSFMHLELRAQSTEDVDSGLAPIRVEDMRERLERAGKLKDTIVKTEVINDRKIEKKQAQTLTEAVQNEPGIDAASGCSICGMKRIQINGLRGEYTTVLVDDVPMHSTVSSYYGMDALTTAGVARVEVARGAGASLLAPGALGGVINIVTQKAVEDALLLNISGGNQEYRTFSLVGTSVGREGKRRTTVSAQHNHQGQWDGDGNGVNESPRLNNHALSVRVSDDLSQQDNLDFRLGLQRSDVFGGPMTDQLFRGVLTPGARTFELGDVRRRYTGAPAAVLEAVTTERLEGTAKWLHRFTESTNTTLTASAVTQTQDSFYERADYANLNETLYSDARVNHQLTDHHFFTFGADARRELLRSQSWAFFSNPEIAKDDFDFVSTGPYGQHVWSPTESFELSSAVRFDYLRVNWLGRDPGAAEIDQFVLAPRFHARWNTHPDWTSRLSLGWGYRAPLTFFESEHGILEDGFNIEVTDLERSTSLVYALSYDTPRTTATVSAAWTHIRNMAYVQFSDVVRPTLRTDDGLHDVFTVDGVVGYQLTRTVTLGASYEHFIYNNRYKSLLPFAAVEDRARLLVDVENGGWDFNLTATWVGGRNLLPYNYGDRFNVFDGVSTSDPKLTQSPPFITLDSRVAWEVSSGVRLFAGVKNLLGFTQAQVENPLFYEPDGNFDVIHLWGPLRGREIYVGLSAKL